MPRARPQYDRYATEGWAVPVTTGTGTCPPIPELPAPALTVEEVAVAVICPLCSAPPGIACDHTMARLRCAVRAAQASGDDA